MESERYRQVTNGPCEAEQNALLFLMEIQQRLCRCAGQRVSREIANSVLLDVKPALFHCSGKWMWQLERTFWQGMGGTSCGDCTSHLPAFLPICATGVHCAGVKSPAEDTSQKFQCDTNSRLLPAPLACTSNLATPHAPSGLLSPQAPFLT